MEFNAQKNELITLKDRKVRILVADDDKFYLRILTDLIKELGHESLAVENGLEALEKVKDYKPDLIISDVVMPGMDGFELTRRLKQDPLTMYTPVLIVTSLSDRDSKVKGLHCGADELLSKPIDETEFQIRIKNMIKVKVYEHFLVEHGKRLEGEVVNKSNQLAEALEKIRSGYVETVYRLTLAAEYRDKETGEHIKRISLYSQLIARYIGLNEELVEAIFLASPMHDVGKIGIPDAILLKPGKHTSDEFETMKTHTTIGGAILQDSDSLILKTAQEIALSHHEKWNGQGYPQGIRGTDIPVSSRIVHLVDIYDALRSKRPYKSAFDHKTACEIILKEPESFDPEILAAFKECEHEFKRLFDEHQ